MKLAQLKQQAHESWETLNLIDGAIPSPDQFRQEMRQYGDLRCKVTWEQACIDLEAKWIVYGLENWALVRYFQKPDTIIGQQFNHQVLNVVLSYPRILEQIKQGLECLYYSPNAVDDRAIAVAFLQRLSGYGARVEMSPILTAS